jgi:hypothetical protein
MLDTLIRFFAVVGLVACTGGLLVVGPMGANWLKQLLRKKEA